MAEFCLECWNRLNETEKTGEEVILTKHLDLCEGCGEMKQVVECPFPYEKPKRRLLLFFWIRGFFSYIWNDILNIVYAFKRRKR